MVLGVDVVMQMRLHRDVLLLFAAVVLEWMFPVVVVGRKTVESFE